MHTFRPLAYLVAAALLVAGCTFAIDPVGPRAPATAEPDLGSAPVVPPTNPDLASAAPNLAPDLAALPDCRTLGCVGNWQCVQNNGYWVCAQD